MTAVHPSAAPAGSPPSAPRDPWRPRVVRGAVVAVIVVAGFAVLGAIAGVVWHQLWTPPSGEVYQHQWYAARGTTVATFSTDETSLGAMFGGTGLFVLVGLAGGLVLGVVTALAVRHDEVAATIGIVLGGAAAAALCHVVGVHLGPPDPAAVARHEADFTVVPDSLSVSGKVPYAMWVLGACVGLGVTYLSSSAKRRTLSMDADPAWLGRTPTG